MLSMYQQITIKTLKNQGKSNKNIALEMNCHRNTVSNILRQNLVRNKQTRIKSSYFDPYYQIIESWVKLNITRLRIWEKLRDEYGMNRKYDTLCKYIQSNFGKKIPSYVVQQCVAGEEAEVDFGYCGMFRDQNGQLRKVWVFHMVLGYSRFEYYGLVQDQSVQSFVNQFIESFNFFGGVPKRIKVDNLKAAVIKNRRYDLEINKDFLDFSYHYNFIIVPCTPYEPQQKGKVESGIGYVEKNFLNGRHFDTITELRTALKNWLINTAIVRIHGTTKKIPKEVFQQEEKGQLQSLPETTFLFYQTAERLVKPNCHINFNNNYYSVPEFCVGRTVEVRWHDKLIRIFHQHDLIATHVLNSGTGEYITNTDHFPDYKVYSETTYQAKYEAKMKEIGPQSHTFFKTILANDPKAWNRTIRKILGLTTLYNNQKIDLAIGRAMTFGAYHYSIVKNICDQNLESSEVEPKLIDSNSLKPDELLSEPLSRELSYYSELSS